MSMNDDDRHEDFMPTGDSTHVVNQVIKDSGQTYRFRVGEARVEGRLTGRVLLMNVLGDFEVVEPGQMTTIKIEAEILKDENLVYRLETLVGEHLSNPEGATLSGVLKADG